MNLKFIEGGKAGYKVVKFRGVGVAYKKVVDGEGEGGGVSVVAEEHRGWRFQNSRVGLRGRQGEVGIRAPIGEDQAQFSEHHRR